MGYEHLKYLEEVIKKEINKGLIQGASIQVVHKNKIVYETEQGYAVKEKNIPMGKDTIHRMFSMTKPVTAVATMILYERGLIGLLDPVHHYLEGFKEQKVWTEDGLVDVVKPVTIKDLLNMTSGMMYPDMGCPAGREMARLYEEVEQEEQRGKPVNTVELVNRMGRVPLDFQPGSRWRYGTSADVLGGLIEVVAKKSFGEFLKDEIFTPLGMVDTDFYVPEDKIHRFSELYDYIQDRQELIPCSWNHLGLNNYKTKPAFESGGAGLVSTLSDYQKFALMLSNMGTYNGVRILGRKTVEYLTKPQLSGDDMSYKGWETMFGYDYGNLMRFHTEQAKSGHTASLHEYGWDGWTGNYFFIDPTENLIMLYMVQKCGGTNSKLMNRFRSIIYSAIE